MVKKEYSISFRDIVESWVDFIGHTLKIKNKEQLQIDVVELSKTIYLMGYEDARKDLQAEQYGKEILN